VYFIEIREPNKFFVINGKAVRSPFESLISESDLRTVKATIRSYGIMDYTLSKVTENKDGIFYDQMKVPDQAPRTFETLPVLTPEVYVYDEDIKIDGLNSKFSSILEKYLKESE